VTGTTRVRDMIAARSHLEVCPRQVREGLRMVHEANMQSLATRTELHVRRPSPPSSPLSWPRAPCRLFLDPITCLSSPGFLTAYPMIGLRKQIESHSSPRARYDRNRSLSHTMCMSHTVSNCVANKFGVPSV
jgi:hypothetical protein